jgi:hypothetical protein
LAPAFSAIQKLSLSRLGKIAYRSYLRIAAPDAARPNRSQRVTAFKALLGTTTQQRVIVGSAKIAFERCGAECLFRARLLLESVGDLADKLGPSHVHGPVNLAGFWTRIVFEEWRQL